MPFVFSADGHIREPGDLFSAVLPAADRDRTLRIERQGDYVLSFAGERLLSRFHTAPERAVKDMSRPHVRGAYERAIRLDDMASQGIDAEILFPTLGLMTFLLQEAEIELSAVQAYNDYVDGFVGDRRDVFVRCAILPLRDGFRYTVQEMKRVAALGFTAAMIPVQCPSGIPRYNDPAWDQVFEAAAALGVVLVVHSATGIEDIRFERGAGGAVINYTGQISDALGCLTYMVGGGLLDRHPTAQVAIIECGASWLAGAAERMDEVYHAHDFHVAPKLSRLPSEIVRQQVSCSFQRDRAAIMSRAVTGHRGLLWAADYPHNEGTWPHSREVVAGLFDGIEISDAEKADILGGNAARLFRLENHLSPARSESGRA